MRFTDRSDAGRQLAEALAPYGDHDSVVLGLARGGVAVAAEVAKRLALPLDVMVARKLGAPGNPEFAIGAVAADIVQVNEALARRLHADEKYLADAIAEARREQQRRVALYRAGRPPLPDLIRDRTVLLVDDGLATGSTARAAAEAVRRMGAARVVFAAPVCEESHARALGEVADHVICLTYPEPFVAVGNSYDQFDPLPDEAVLRYLRESDPSGGTTPAPAAAP